MSKERDGIGDDERLAPATDGSTAAEPETPAELTDPESQEPDANQVEAQIEAAEEAQSPSSVVGGAGSEVPGTDQPAVRGAEVAEVAGGSEADDSAEPDGADDFAAADVGSGAAGAGSARAAAHRSATATTPKKDAPTRQRDVEEKDGFLARISRFLREVVAELRKVIWPSRKQMVTYTIVVITFLVIMTALVAGLDVLFLTVVDWVFG